MSRPELKEFKEGRPISRDVFRYNTQALYDSLTNTRGEVAGHLNEDNYGTGIHADQFAGKAIDATKHVPTCLSRAGGSCTDLQIGKVNGIKLVDLYKRMMLARDGVYVPQFHEQVVSHGETFLSTAKTIGGGDPPIIDTHDPTVSYVAPEMRCGGIGAYGQADQVLTNTIAVELPPSFDYDASIVMIDPFYQITATLSATQVEDDGATPPVVQDQGWVRYYTGKYEGSEDIDWRMFPGEISGMKDTYVTHPTSGVMLQAATPIDDVSGDVDIFMQGRRLQMDTQWSIKTQLPWIDGDGYAKCWSFKGVRYDISSIAGNAFNLDTTLIGNGLYVDPQTGRPGAFYDIQFNPVVRLDITATYKITALRFRKVF